MNDTPLSSRRTFIKTSTSVAVGAALASQLRFPSTSFAANSDTLKIGLVGCGGRGTGAAAQALAADPNVVLSAVGDIFKNKIEGALVEAHKAAPGRVKVTPETTFVGLDAFQKVIDSGVDVVLLASPPGFRPQHLKAAVAAGKHVFCEKPMATDAPGIRSVLVTAEEARKKNLALVAGFCWRYDYARREFYKRIHGGQIGEVRSIHATYLAGPVKPMPPASNRPPGMSDVEWQLRNWYNFVWLSGDGLVEQACHSVDKIAWGMNGVLPLKAVASGGRSLPNGEGNIYDHIEVCYEFPNGIRAFMSQRQIPGCYSENNDYVTGSTGIGTIRGWEAPTLVGAQRWKYSGENLDMYQVEHNELFASIRSGKVINDGIWMAHSSLMAIMGRMAAYTGQTITWEQAMGSKEQLVPDAIKWDGALAIKPLAIPGQTKFV